MEPLSQLPHTEQLTAKSDQYKFPDQPFEQIGFALSGGGFRAACYGLGVLSLMDYIRTDRNKDSTLLEKVKFVSSASGGTITLAMYLASLSVEMKFAEFYKIACDSMKGDDLVNEAINILKDDQQWVGSKKSRNIINAFSLAYDQKLFGLFIDKNVADLGCLIDSISAKDRIHIEEFCFNSSEFYSGISFRFQAGTNWVQNENGQFGSGSITLNWKSPLSVSTLRKIKLADVLASSSCFPLGFEPMVYPYDFTYKNGPASQDLKDAITVKTHSWDDDKTPEQNQRSPRATREKAFADKKEFGLMDGGICDNQGLFSMLLANERNVKDGACRFDLMMVSDVTSYFMDPYEAPAIKPPADFTGTTLTASWQKITGGFAGLKKWALVAWVVSLIIAMGSLMPLLCGDKGTAAIMLAVLGVGLFCLVSWAKLDLSGFLSKNKAVDRYLSQPDLPALVRIILPEANFMQRTAVRIVDYLQHLETGIIIQMLMARVKSSVTMINDVFLKHIRRLIYESFYENRRYTYRRVSNLIYELTFTNDDARALPRFEPRENEPAQTYNARREQFRNEIASFNPISDAMRKTAELAYNTGTTLWFEDQQENPGNDTVEKNREAIIATGQFTTCHNLLNYTTMLFHSRQFDSLSSDYQNRIKYIKEQLTELASKFQSDPYYLYKLYK
ncbi:MAG: hypothetical protein EOO88_08905 [Pedobacter sp.]|nr:MAG: hypothetical protein EOO88_08905 [Pedobacter sp.]